MPQIHTSSHKIVLIEYNKQDDKMSGVITPEYVNYGGNKQGNYV
jgi:hypothetical protein